VPFSPEGNGTRHPLRPPCPQQTGEGTSSHCQRAALCSPLPEIPVLRGKCRTRLLLHTVNPATIPQEHTAATHTGKTGHCPDSSSFTFNLPLQRPMQGEEHVARASVKRHAGRRRGTDCHCQDSREKARESHTVP